MGSKSISLILLASIAMLGVAFLLSSGANAQSNCTQSLEASTTEGSWTDACDSENRENAYARFYTFSLTEGADVTITLNSATDPYLFLLDGDGDVVAENDDIARYDGNYTTRASLKRSMRATTPSKRPHTPRLRQGTSR